MEAIQQRLDADPVFRAQYERMQRGIQADQNNANRTARTSVLPDSVIIPVVVHIVLPNPNIVTDADVQYFMNRLNLDFSGRNPDSTNGANFYNVRGRSKIRFALARRTPGGLLTNGIERRVGNVVMGFNTYQPLKHFSDGGLDPWNVTQYYNVWVGIGATSGGGTLLGIAPAIGVGGATETTTSQNGIDGVCINYLTFSNNSCYSPTWGNLARTGVHEVGHNFGLYHIFQDGCANGDFSRNLTTAPAQVLPDSLLSPSDDTPAQNNETTGCPSGTVAAGCPSSPTPPGRMFSNYMDYTDDGCMAMFSVGQVKRMHYILEYFRAGYLTTQGHIPPAGAVLLDAEAFESVNPGGYELNGCAVVNYPSSVNCAGSFAPKFRVRNNGLTPITSITVGWRLNSGAAATVNITGINIPAGGTYVATLPAQTLIDGTNQLQFFTALAGDQNPANDTLNTALSISTTPLPVTETFESPTFPPPPWTVVSVNSTGTQNWIRRAPGRNSGFSLFIENYSNSSGAIDDFRSGSFAAAPTDIVNVNFDLAYKFYGTTTTTSPDTLVVLVSSDCGVTFTEVYKKWGVNLATAGGQFASYIAPVAADWRTETITLPASVLTNGKFQVIFRSKSRFGNNIFIDNINIEKKYDRDIRVLSLVSPVGNICSNTVAPQVQVTNPGLETINSFTLSYTINGIAAGSINVTTPLAPGATTTVTLPVGNVPTFGVQTFVVTATNVVFASGNAEQNTANNSATGTATRIVLNTRIQEGFEVIPPPGWTAFNPNANNTWGIIGVGNNSARSAFINNYDFNVPGNFDDLRSPFLNTAGVDSIIVSFDLAHKAFSAVDIDSLKVMAITGCGSVTTPTAYAKGGLATLATAGVSTASYLNPAPADWRRERVSIGSNILGTGGNLQVAFRNVNGFGNNVFIDNVLIEPLYRRDLQLLSVNRPAPNAITCTNTVTPNVTVRNNGTEVITGYRVGYTIDGGAAITQTVTGVSIPRDGTATINLPVSGNFTPGVHTIRVFSFDPVTVSGTGDQFTGNDTLTSQFTYLITVSAPLNETFVNTTFPPANWAVRNPDGGITWSRSPAGNGNPGSAFVNTFNYTANGQQDDLVTPFVSYSNADTVNLSFDVAAVTYSYPGSTAIPIDTLEVLLSADCGNTYTSVYKKWGIDLQTIGAPNDPNTGEFTPNAPNQWRRESLNLAGFTGNGNLSVMFRVSNNFENNVFVDNVNLTARTLPSLLKQQGFLILPTVFNSSFTVWQYAQASRLQYINVVNSAGQRVWTKQFNGTANTQEQVNLSNMPAGVYFVELGFNDRYRNVTQKVVKY